MRRKTSSLYSEAIKQIKRLEKAARRAEKRGYKFDLPFRKTKSGQEKTRYTKKEVEWLKSLKTKDLYQYSTYDGKSGVERRAEERREASKKAAETRAGLNKPFEFDARKSYQEYQSVTRTIIDNFLEREKFIKLNTGVDKYECDSAYQYVVDFTNKVISDPEVGASGLAWALEEANNDGLVMEIHLSYWWQIRGNMSKLVPYLPSKYEDDIKFITFTDSAEEEEPFPVDFTEKEGFIRFFND